MTSKPSKKPKYDKAFQFLCQSKYEIEGLKPAEISEIMSVPATQVTKWKVRQNWCRKGEEIAKIDQITKDKLIDIFVSKGLPVESVIAEIVKEIKKQTTDGPTSKAKLAYIEKYFQLVGMGQEKGLNPLVGEGGVVNFNISQGGVELPPLKEIVIVEKS